MQNYVNLGSGAPEMDSIQVGDTLRVEMFTIDGDIKLKERNISPIFGIGIGGSVISSIETAAGTVYFGACDKKLYAVDLKTGKERWSFSAGDVVWDLTVTDFIYFTSYDGCLYKVTLDGKLVWKYRTPDKLACKPAVSGGKVFFTGKDGHLHALDDVTGRLLWKVVDGTPSWGDPEVKDGIVYIGFQSGNCYAVAENGEVKWKFTARGPTGNPVLFAGLICFPSWDGNVYALRLDGTLAWTYTAGAKISVGGVVGGETMVVFSGRNRMHAIAPDGTERWTIATESSIILTSAIDETQVYAGTIEGNLYIVNWKTGEMVRKVPIGGKVISTARSTDRLFFGCYDCKVVCTDLDGTFIWMFPTSLSYLSPVDWELLNPQTVTSTQLRAAEALPEPEAYRTSRTVSGEGLGVYGGLNITYAGSGMYAASGRYGGHGRHGH